MVGEEGGRGLVAGGKEERVTRQNCIKNEVKCLKFASFRVINVTSLQIS